MIMYCSLGYNTTALNNEAALDSRYLSSRLVASNKAGIASLGNKKMISVWEETDIPGGSDRKESASSAGDPCSVPGLEISTGEGNGNPLQYSCLGNPKGRGDW